MGCSNSNATTKDNQAKPKTEPKIEKVYYDTDMPSDDAMMDLYNNGVSISQISKVLSVGMIGR